MAAFVMDGALLAGEIVTRLHAEIAAAGHPDVCIATLLVGGDAADVSNVKRKHVRALEAGMRFVDRRLPADATQRDVEEAVSLMSYDTTIHGIFVQLPLPAGLDAVAIVERIAPQKDIDGLTSRSAGALLRNEPGYMPAAPRAAMRLLERYDIKASAADIVIVGRSADFSLPLSILFGRSANARVAVLDRDNADIVARCRAADILVTATNVCGWLTADYVAPGAVVIDAGVSRPAGKPAGDVDTTSVRTVARAIAPVPGGVGPVTVACLLESVWSAADGNAS